MSAWNYIKIVRPNHWLKNIFMFPGFFLALLAVHNTPKFVYFNLIVGLASACFVVSANYVINEWFDADSDKHHPLKKNRPSVLGSVRAKFVYLEYGVLVILGLGTSLLVSTYFFYTALGFLVMGIIYNVRPFRAKDKIYLDVLSESVNNPIRFLLGWFIVTSSFFPPSSILIAYWMGGAFLMSVKRFSEYRFIADKKVAGLYRRSFLKYNENNLLVSILIYAMSFSFFFCVFMIKYRIELLLALPLFLFLFGWYLALGMKVDSPAQRPETLYQEKAFVLFIAVVIIFILVLLFYDFPALKYFLEKDFNINYVIPR